MTDEEKFDHLFEQAAEASKDRHNLRTELGQRLSILELKHSASGDSISELKELIIEQSQQITDLTRRLDKMSSFWSGMIFVAGGAGVILGWVFSYFKPQL